MSYRLQYKNKIIVIERLMRIISLLNWLLKNNALSQLLLQDNINWDQILGVFAGV